MGVRLRARFGVGLGKDGVGFDQVEAGSRLERGGEAAQRAAEGQEYAEGRGARALAWRGRLP